MAMSTSENIFKDDPFFSEARFLWPMTPMAPMQPMQQQRRSSLRSSLMGDVAGIREDFFQRRAALVQSLRSEMRSSLLNDLCQGLPAGLLQSLSLEPRRASSPAASTYSSSSSTSYSPSPAPPPSTSSCASPTPSCASSCPSPFVTSPSPSPSPFCASPSSPTPSPCPSVASSLPSRVVTTSKAVQPVNQDNNNGNQVVTFDTRGFSPEDIRVTVSGRQLEVMATKQAEAADQATVTSERGFCTSAKSSARQQGFIQRVQLPAGVEPGDVTCSLGEDGLLRVETRQRTAQLEGGAREEVKQLEEPKKEQQHQEATVVSSVEEPAQVRYRTSLDFPIKGTGGPAPEVTFNKSL